MPMPALRLPGDAKRFLPIAFAVVMGSLAVAVMRQYLMQEYRKLEHERQKLIAMSQQNLVETVVSSRDLEEGSTLAAADLKTVRIPELFTQPYSVRSPQDLIGMITRAPIADGEQILSNKVRRPDEAPKEAILSTMTPKGKRAVTVGVDALTGVGGFVRPGDIVDILWTLAVPQPGQQTGEPVTVVLFQGVPVLAVGREMVGYPASTTEAANEYTVTLALSPQETSFLLFAREQGRIQLSLRPHLEGDAPVQVAPANITSLLESQLGIKTPQATPPRPPRHVEVYKGLKREVVDLAEDNQSNMP